MPARVLDLHVHVYPAPDMKGQWMAHCLDLDVVSQGDSLGHAARMVQEAVAQFIGDARAAGRDPLDSRAPPDAWTAMWEDARRAKPTEAEELLSAKTSVAGSAVFFLRMTLDLRAGRASKPDRRKRPLHPRFEVPLVLRAPRRPAAA